MDKRTRKILSAVLLVVFLASTGSLLWNFFSYADGGDVYSDAAELARSDSGNTAETTQTKPTEPAAATQPPEETKEPVLVWIPAPLSEEDPEMEALQETDISALRQVNGDVIGWIQIPGTKVDYPMVQGEDNEYYLNHIWKGNKHYVGSVFLECMNTPDFTDWHTIIYAHNMSDGSMFGSLHKYKNESYWKKHPYVYIVTDTGVLRYEIFSTYTANVGSKTYGLSFRQTETRAEFLAMVLEKSQIDTGIVPELTDQIITLSTCSGGKDTRRVVHARLPMIQVAME